MNLTPLTTIAIDEQLPLEKDTDQTNDISNDDSDADPDYVSNQQMKMRNMRQNALVSSHHPQSFTYCWAATYLYLIFPFQHIDWLTWLAVCTQHTEEEKGV